MTGLKICGRPTSQVGWVNWAVLFSSSQFLTAVFRDALGIILSIRFSMNEGEVGTRHEPVVTRSTRAEKTVPT